MTAREHTAHIFNDAGIKIDLKAGKAGTLIKHTVHIGYTSGVPSTKIKRRKVFATVKHMGHIFNFASIPLPNRKVDNFLTATEGTMHICNFTCIQFFKIQKTGAYRL